MRYLAILAVLVLCLTGCKDEISSDECRLDPASCNGGAGGFCNNDDDCISELSCCTQDDNCGDGMCTTSCDRDGDCPDGMRCEHNLCFYACDVDSDCSENMKCEHDNTVCEYE
jgi:hypothetical protein